MATVARARPAMVAGAGSHSDGGCGCEQVWRCRLRARLLCNGSVRARHRVSAGWCRDGGSAGLV